MSVRAAIEAGTAPYVRVADGFLEIAPGILPSSSTRFHRGRAAPAAAATGSGRFPRGERGHHTDGSASELASTLVMTCKAEHPRCAPRVGGRP